MSETPTTAAPATGTVTSADGTTIGYRRFGHGPAVILVHGGMQASQNFRKLAAELADEFEVFVPDRRGRGMSGPYGDHYEMRRDVDDMQALITASGATRIFGLSSGALVTLRTALATPTLTKVALYEPPLSINGSVAIGFQPRYERELHEGRIGAALATALKGLGTEPVLRRIPRFIVVPMFSLGMRAASSAAAGEVPISELVPTFHYDLQLVRELSDTLQEYSALTADTLLLEGSRSPAYLRRAAEELSRAIPNSRLVTMKGLGHSGPDDDGNPALVAAELRAFLR
jgi:pimeloyl-ACP methyl ester carboxylesterase